MGIQRDRQKPNLIGQLIALGVLQKLVEQTPNVTNYNREGRETKFLVENEKSK